MGEKYKNLNNLSISLKCFRLRLKKENRRLNKFKEMDYINELNLSDDIINDIIQLILDESGLTLKELITDINLSVEERYNWKHGCYTTVPKKKIRSKKELIYHLKTSHSNCDLLNSPINNLLIWCKTNKGFNFYSKLNMKVNKLLKPFKKLKI